MAELSFRKLQHDAKESSKAFLEEADRSRTGKDAAEWAWSAKNAVAVAVSCETILKIQNSGGR